jgi:hypothetical protein
MNKFWNSLKKSFIVKACCLYQTQELSKESLVMEFCGILQEGNQDLNLEFEFGVTHTLFSNPLDFGNLKINRGDLGGYNILTINTEIYSIIKTQITEYKNGSILEILLKKYAS